MGRARFFGGGDFFQENEARQLKKVNKIKAFWGLETRKNVNLPQIYHSRHKISLRKSTTETGSVFFYAVLRKAPGWGEVFFRTGEEDE